MILASLDNVFGHCEPGFGVVADRLSAFLREGREVGASVGVYCSGRPVVGIWGGSADQTRTVPWSEETITPLASVSKALASVAVLTLVDRGAINLDQPVSLYWQRFGDVGKADTTVAVLLAHRSGVVALDRPISNDDAARLDPVLRRIEQQQPWWPAGTRHGYHAMTYGFLLSGLVRSVTGRSVGQFFADEVASRLALDLHLGLPPQMAARVAPMVPPSGRSLLRSSLDPMWLRYALRLLLRRSASYRATFGGTTVGFRDDVELVRYEVEDASAGGVGNGTSLARLFAALIGTVDGCRLIGRDLVERARIPHATGRDEVLRVRTDWGLGFALPGGPMWPNLGVPGVFGHTGASGSWAFADPDHDIAFGYTPNYWGELSGGARRRHPRCLAYAEAAYAGAGIRRWPALRR